MPETRQAAREGSLLRKTCDTCFRAKIRCERSQDSGPCDRCHRLEKPCIFKPTKKKNAVGASNAPRRMGRMEIQRDHVQAFQRSPLLVSRPLHQPEGTILPPDGDSDMTVSNLARQAVPPTSLGSSPSAFDPVTAGVISLADADRALGVFKSQMASHFPFVVLSEQVGAFELQETRPCLCLGILAVACFHDPERQHILGKMFNEMVATKLVDGNLADLDLLQGLLVHLAWAQYEPRPRRYSQFLHLAISIVSDMRLDRPRNLQLWDIDKLDAAKTSEWGPEELRALVGTYYLASSSSIVLLKLRSFPFSSFILDCSEELVSRCLYPTDKYLSYIVRVQRLSEKASDLSNRDLVDETSSGDLNRAVESLRVELDALKSTVSFPFSECPTLLLQINTLALQIGQECLPGFPFAAAKVQGQDSQLVHRLSECILAAKAVVDMFLVMPPQGEFTMTNMGWIMCSCGLSISVRLDILAANPRISTWTAHLRRLLDMRHILKQSILRLEFAVSSQQENNSEGGMTYQMLKRARAIETWYLKQAGIPSLSTPAEAPKDDAHSTSHGTDAIDATISESHLIDITALGPDGEVAQPEFDFSITDVFNDMDMQGVNFTSSIFTSNYQYFS